MEIVRLLLVEDDAGTVQKIEEFLGGLHDCSYTFQHASGLGAAIELLSSDPPDPPDFALLDLGLPDSDGLESLVRLRECAPALPIVVLTGLENAETEKRAIALGAQDCLVKGQFDGRLLARVLGTAKQRLLLELELRRKTAELRENETRLETLFESSKDGLLLIDPAWTILRANRAFSEIAGAPKEAIVGRALFDLHPPGDRVWIQEALEREVRGLLARASDLPIVRPDGTCRFVEVLTSPFQVGDRVLRILTARDVTERTRVLAGLALADRRASLGLLAAGLAHELNNPLTYVLYNLSTVGEDLQSVVQALEALATHTEVPSALASLCDIHTRIQAAQAGSSRIHEIVQTMNLFSRVESEELRPVSLNAAIEVAATLAHNEVKYRARFVKELGTVPAVMADEGRLAQVFLNLIINAAQAISEGSSDRNEIRVGTWAEGPNVFAEVRDTGHGIPPEIMSRIFEPFFSTHPRGSGLGLAVVRTIVHEAGGEIEVSSQPGQGARFRVRMPAVTMLPPPIEQGVELAPDLRGRVLIIDDDPNVRAAMGRILCRHTLVACGSGEEGRATLESDPAFDAIVCDVILPCMTGVDLFEWIRAHRPELADRVIFITGGAFTGRTRSALTGLTNRRIEKPFEPQTLRKVIQEVLRTRKAE